MGSPGSHWRKTDTQHVSPDDQELHDGAENSRIGLPAEAAFPKSRPLFQKALAHALTEPQKWRRKATMRPGSLPSDSVKCQGLPNTRSITCARVPKCLAGAGSGRGRASSCAGMAAHSLPDSPTSTTSALQVWTTVSVHMILPSSSVTLPLLVRTGRKRPHPRARIAASCRRVAGAV